MVLSHSVELNDLLMRGNVLNYDSVLEENCGHSYNHLIVSPYMFKHRGGLYKNQASFNDDTAMVRNMSRSGKTTISPNSWLIYRKHTGRNLTQHQVWLMNLWVKADLEKLGYEPSDRRTC